MKEITLNISQSVNNGRVYTNASIAREDVPLALAGSVPGLTLADISVTVFGSHGRTVKQGANTALRSRATEASYEINSLKALELVEAGVAVARTPANNGANSFSEAGDKLVAMAGGTPLAGEADEEPDSD